MGPGAKPEISKDVHEAFRDTCYAAGVPELAAKMGTSPGVLYNKCNTNETVHHQPTLRDGVLAQVITGDKRITRAMAALLGGVFVDLSGAQKLGDDALLDLVAQWMREQGKLFADFHTAYSDGVIDHHELKEIRQDAFEVLEAILSFLKRVEDIAK